MELSPVPFDYDEDTQHISWVADLFLDCRDLPRLMREGLHLTTANIRPELSYINTEESLDEARRKEGWRKSRNYVLSDLGEDCYWAARLEVYARELKVLSQVRVSDLQHHMILGAVAFRSHVSAGSLAHFKRQIASDELAYCFDSFRPSDSINAIYDDMPLEGLWPWPKRVSGKAKEGDAEKTETELSETVDRPLQPPRGAMHSIRTFCSGLRCW
ncbi:hypothetical protein CMUS01_03651 [Colletotrichum musicola]|uniref:Uncharacterized protein n=1 Tax=Colletotrichum musicola TaxID=2175873 RepID=A0A8H6NR39_9PEZI|nr:hypothetical protein CMUS01_03651 [Colletotrichum musicola]